MLSRYFQERLLYRLSVSEYKDRFILKGGALLYAHDGFQARPTLDIDFMARRISNDAENIKGIFSEICQIDCPEDGLTFDSDTIETGEIAITKEYHGVRVSLMAHLDTAQQLISMDVGFGDVITPYPQQLAFPALIDTVPGTTILAYSLETVVAEEFFTDANRNLYWEGFLRRIKFGETLSFVAVGELIRNRLQPYWEGLRG